MALSPLQLPSQNLQSPQIQKATAQDREVEVPRFVAKTRQRK